MGGAQLAVPGLEEGSRYGPVPVSQGFDFVGLKQTYLEPQLHLLSFVEILAVFHEAESG